MFEQIRSVRDECRRSLSRFYETHKSWGAWVFISRELGRVWSASVLRPTFQIAIVIRQRPLAPRPPSLLSSTVLDSSKPPGSHRSVHQSLCRRPLLLCSLLLSWHLPNVSKQDHKHTLLNWNQICTWMLLRSLVANTEKRVSRSLLYCSRLRPAAAKMGTRRHQWARCAFTCLHNSIL